MATVDEHEELRRQGEAIHASITAAEQAAEDERARRTEHMRRMHIAGVSWAAIGRTFRISPQAAMYATGFATRTPKKKPEQA